MTNFSVLPVREQIMDAVKERLESMKKNLPTDDPNVRPYAFGFDHVQRQPFTSASRGKEYICAIIDNNEFKEPDTDPVVRSTINVIIEFLVLVKSKENPTTKMNLVFAETERRLKEDRTFGNLAIDIVVTSSETDIESDQDKYIEGALFFDIKYRHNNNDPSLRV